VDSKFLTARTDHDRKVMGAGGCGFTRTRIIGKGPGGEHIWAYPIGGGKNRNGDIGR